jgi:hypothetical protein
VLLEDIKLYFLPPRRRYRRSRNASAEGLSSPKLQFGIEFRGRGARTEDRADGLRDERAIAAADGDEIGLGMAGVSKRERRVFHGRGGRQNRDGAGGGVLAGCDLIGAMFAVRVSTGP